MKGICILLVAVILLTGTAGCDSGNEPVDNPPSIEDCEAAGYAGFYDFPASFFEESSVPREQVEQVVSAQYLSLKKMHNGIAPRDYVGEFCRVEYDPEAFGYTTPYGFILGDYAFPSRNSGHHYWGVMAHEQGHNFFGGTSWFYYQMAAPYPFLQESLAVLSSFYTYHDMTENQESYCIDDDTIASLIFDFANGRADHEQRYNQYINQGRNFDIEEVLTSQALDFKMILYGEEYGWDKFQRLAKAFEDELGEVFDFHEDGATAEEQSTYIVAAMAVAFDELVDEEVVKQDFVDDLNFPIDDTLYDESFAGIKAYVG